MGGSSRHRAPRWVVGRETGGGRRREEATPPPRVEVAEGSVNQLENSPHPSPPISHHQLPDPTLNNIKDTIEREQGFFSLLTQREVWEMQVFKGGGDLLLVR